MVNIGGVKIGPDQPCRLVAEISCNHAGNENRAIRLIEAAKDAGADFVKFQAYLPSELVALRGDGPAPEPWGSQGHTMASLYEIARTPMEWFPGLFAAARALGIVPFSSVFGAESLEVLESCDCPAYKIAALDAHQEALKKLVRRTGKPTILSVRRPRYHADVILHCPPGYPQDEADIAWEDMELGIFDGFSYHGTDWLIPARAAKAGAQLVEFHFHLADEPSELEANVSLTEHDVRALIEHVRRTE